jgi:hypothetical protein
MGHRSLQGANPRCEAIMANAVSRPLFGTVRIRPRFQYADDPLDAMRGVIFGTMISLALFWFPLTVALSAH